MARSKNHLTGNQAGTRWRQEMIRKNFFALAAATAMTLSTFAGTLAVLSVGAPATAHQASVA